MLKIKNIRKTYGDKIVIRDISLSASRGEIVGILGPNGAGKTTCFYIISGLIKADSGKISLNNKDISNFPMYQRARLGLGYLPQEASIFRGLTVEDNIMAILELVEENYNKRQIILDQLLGDFSIAHLRKSLGISLSGGERRRVEIARALAANPNFILLDEPLAGVDPIAIAEIKELIYNLKQRNIGVIITDHNVKETLDIVDKAYIIHEGVVLKSGNAKEIIADKLVRKVYLGDSLH